MSEEILRALMQLFAIIAKQDAGVETNQVQYVHNFLSQQLGEEEVQEYFNLFKKQAGMDDEGDEEEVQEDGQKKKRLTSVKESVKVLGICKKINKTLTQKQKIVVLVRLFEIVNTDRNFTEQRMAIINTVAEVFNIQKEEFEATEQFVINNQPDELDDQHILIINDSDQPFGQCKRIKTKELDAEVFILRIKSVELYFMKYTGHEDLFLNGLPISNSRIYLFANGSTIKLPKGRPIYYSDIAGRFLADMSASRISYECQHVSFQFPNGYVGLRDISFSEGHGRLIGIMGASGAGKTTLLNVLSGIESPSEGQVLINGLDLHTEKEKLEGVIGYIPQDDLLIEELTVYQNLYYNAKLCFKDKGEEEINQMVEKTLSSLGLIDRKDLKVGSPLNKFISGGQRKRLNIALELIREPSILFVDEPTSGLSSRDSENVMDLLRELTLKGKLIFVVIHQPSSEIYKMFDKMIILDTGGYLVYYGNPVEGVMYFKRLDMQINSDVGECPTCGNVNPELIFNIIEAKVVDEYGNLTDNRKVSPQKWEDYFKQNLEIEEAEKVNDPPPKSLNIPNWLKQFKIYTVRDFLSKISNRQYIALNLLEAPVLGFILSFIIRYIADPESNVYIFRENENIHIYIFMALIVALFLGLTVSAEEIFRDRKILKRESFLNLSRSSYLISKVLLLFTISAIQAITFILIANTILGIKGMTFHYWFALFSTAAFANMLGLNVSASFNSAVTIYIIIPLLMIPMMILSGAMFPFDKLNRTISSVGKVPLIAEVMVTKWSYEALMVHQFTNNDFNKVFYPLDKVEVTTDFKKVYFLPELNQRLDNVMAEFNNKGEVDETADDLALIRNEIAKEMRTVPQVEFELFDKLQPEHFSKNLARKIREYFNDLDEHYSREFQLANKKKENKINYIMENEPGRFREMRDQYHNEGIEDIVRKIYEKNKIVEYDNQLIQQIEPIYHDPLPENKWSFRSHFLAPQKHFMGRYIDTYWFNMSVVWLFSIFLYISLYYEWLKKLMNMKLKIRTKGGKK